MNLEQIGDRIRGWLPAAAQIAEVAETLAAVIPGVGNAVAIAKLAIKIANGLANEVPQAVKAMASAKAAREGGVTITDAEWQKWEEDIDEASAGLEAAAKRVINKP